MNDETFEDFLRSRIKDNPDFILRVQEQRGMVVFCIAKTIYQQTLTHSFQVSGNQVESLHLTENSFENFLRANASWVTSEFRMRVQEQSDGTLNFYTHRLNASSQTADFKVSGNTLELLCTTGELPT